MEAKVILKAEAALWTGGQKDHELRFYKLTAMASGLILLMDHPFPATKREWNSVLTGVLSVRVFQLPTVSRPCSNVPAYQELCHLPIDL